jgi:tetratricopeptide (TPR) repeat protein
VAASPVEPASQDDSRQPAHRLRDVLALYPLVRDDHVRTLQKFGLIAPLTGADGERLVAFAGRGVIRQVHAELQRGTRFKTVLHALLASRSGQLSLDFRADAQPARVIALRQGEAAPASGGGVARARQILRQSGVHALPEESLAEQYFRLAASLDEGAEATQAQAADAYRQALEIEPRLVPALINLANIHYARDLRIEAMALYERALALAPDAFEAHYNLGNIHHDLGRYDEAEAHYLHAIELRPDYPEAHLFLAVVLEKAGRSEEARSHWGAYAKLDPAGEWADLAREFSE